MYFLADDNPTLLWYPAQWRSSLTAFQIMSIILENAALRLVLNPTIPEWSIFSRTQNGPFVKGAQCLVNFRRGLRHHRGPDRWRPADILGPAVTPSPHGPLERASIQMGPDRAGLRYTFTFALAREHPLLLWRLQIKNDGPTPVYLGRMELLRVGYPPITRRTGAYPPGSRLGQFQGTIRPHAKPGELGFFSNGWQSWNYHGAYGQFEKPHHTRLGALLKPIVLNASTPLTRKRGHFTSEMFGVIGNRSHRTGILVGFLSQKTHFGTLETWLDPLQPSLRMWASGDHARLDPGAQSTTDWACLTFLHLDSPDPLGIYLDAVSREHNLSPIPAEIPTGWCSWYQFYEDLTAEDIRTNLSAARDLQDQAPMDLFQIDDGYETRIGDWNSFKPGFPEGIAPLAEEIRRAGFKPGLWLAPFIIDRRSEVAQQHPDWLLRNRLGLAVNAGFNWGRFQTALDLTHSDALNHVSGVIRTAVQKWGFHYLKLDFLYAGALPGQHRDPTLSRAQIYRRALKAIRMAAGEETYLLACGNPAGPSLGLVDAMRIGPDTHEIWHPQYRGIRVVFGKEPSLPAAINSLQGTLARAPLHRRWWINDPDCLLLRPTTPLTQDEVRTLATAIALTGGSLFVSDHLPELPPDRRRLLAMLLPPIGGAPHIPDWFDRAPPSQLQLDLQSSLGPWHLIALFNWETVPRSATLDLTDFHLDVGTRYWARTFWTGEVYEVSADPLLLDPIPAHGVILLALRRQTTHSPQYLGSDLHISQGLEVATWDPTPGELSFELTRPGRARGVIELALPAQPARVEHDGEPIRWETPAPERTRIPITMDRTARLYVSWDVP